VNHLTFVVGRLFAKEILPEQDRAAANTMVDNIRTSFTNSLPKLSWIDKETAKVAVAKAKKIVQKIGRYMLRTTSCQSYVLGFC
jgi:predicted metalloendopeptidase